MFKEEEIKKLKTKLINRTEYSNKIKQYLLEEKIPLKNKFIISISELSSQMYGPLLEKVIIKEIKGVSISSRENKGDFKYNDKYYEVKSGLVNNGIITLFQVRPYQEIDYYLTVHYNAKEDKLYIFLIPHKFIKEYCLTINSSSHGSGNDRNSEKQIKININNLKEFKEFKIGDLNEIR